MDTVVNGPKQTGLRKDDGGGGSSAAPNDVTGEAGREALIGGYL